VSNLFARWGRKGANRTFGFNGHTDVVPVGDTAAWTRDPFDRLIVANAMADGATLITADRVILRHFDQAIW
jgi:acetylornithine deacetylase/succinyl-diaminopimelate desuccinylase-like protein